MSGITPSQIKAISVSGLYPALGPTDGAGNPLTKAVLYSDNRSVAEVEEVNQALNLQLTTEELTPKLIWFLRNEPLLASQMRMFFDAPHYLVFKLTGEYVTDTITTGLYGAIYQFTNPQALHGGKTYASSLVFRSIFCPGYILLESLLVR